MDSERNVRRTPAWQNVFVRAASVLLIIFLIGTIVRLNVKANDLVEQKDDLAVEVKEYEDIVEELQDQLDRPYDDDYIKSVAREKLDLRMPDEIIFYNELIK